MMNMGGYSPSDYRMMMMMMIVMMMMMMMIVPDLVSVANMRLV